MQKQEDKFKKMESRLYRYFENINKISAFEKEIVELDKRYDEIEDILKNSNFDFDINLGSPAFEERVQTSCSGESTIEKQVLNQVDRLLREQKLIRKKQFKNKMKIYEIDRNNIKLEVVIAMLRENEQDFVNYKYRDKMSMNNVGKELGLSRRTIYTLRKQVIDKLIKLA